MRLPLGSGFIVFVLVQFFNRDELEILFQLLSRAEMEILFINRRMLFVRAGLSFAIFFRAVRGETIQK